LKSQNVPGEKGYLFMKRRSDVVFWLALQRVLINHPLVANQLLEIYGCPFEIFRAVKSIRVHEGPVHLLKTFDGWDLCEADLKRCQKTGVEIVSLDDPGYPALLKEIAARPVVMMAKGDLETLNGPCVAIVGARKATSHGRETAFEIAKGLAKSGIVVVSGMAYGIDAAAHMGALEEGRTIAVWGSGVDICYPASSWDLSQRIMKSGCVISEFPLGTIPLKQNFPQRNRIISGLSLGTVIVEAASMSGSLITANFALNQGRGVFAVPGPAGGIMSRGTHGLLRSGATFVENADDVIAEIAPQISGHTKNPRHLSANHNNGRPQ
jgi:DNA processing protein